MAWHEWRDANSIRPCLYGINYYLYKSTKGKQFPVEREKLFFLAVKQVNGMIFPPRVTELPGSSSLELVLAASLMAPASHLV